MKKHAMAVIAATLAFAPAAVAEDTKNILVFGDSLTWGWTPVDPIIPTTRHPLADRLTTAMGDALGENYHNQNIA